MNKRMRTLRAKKKYTQLQMQHLTGIDQSDYSKLENGVRNGSIEQFRRIASVLDTSIDYLAHETDDPTRYPNKIKD